MSNEVKKKGEKLSKIGYKKIFRLACRATPEGK